MKSTLTKGALFSCIALLSGACKHYQKIDVENIEKLYVDYSSSDPINYSSPFNAEVVMKMYTGEEVNLVRPKYFTTSKNIVVDLTSKKATMFEIPASFDNDFEVISLMLTDKNGQSITCSDTIRLNFNASLSIGLSEVNGTAGKNGSSGGTGLLFRDRKEGGNGTMD